MDGGTMIVEFSEHEANVPAITDKVKNDLKTEEDIVLCDMQGNRILEGSGTAGIISESICSFDVMLCCSETFSLRELKDC